MEPEPLYPFELTESGERSETDTPIPEPSPTRFDDSYRTPIRRSADSTIPTVFHVIGRRLPAVVSDLVDE